MLSLGSMFSCLLSAGRNSSYINVKIKCIHTDRCKHYRSDYVYATLLGKRPTHCIRHRQGYCTAFREAFSREVMKSGSHEFWIVLQISLTHSLFESSFQITCGTPFLYSFRIIILVPLLFFFTFPAPSSATAAAYQMGGNDACIWIQHCFKTSARQPGELLQACV